MKKSGLPFARELMPSCGQSPITVRREVDGLVVNRLQAVLLREAWALVEGGIASVHWRDQRLMAFARHVRSG